VAQPDHLRNEMRDEFLHVKAELANLASDFRESIRQMMNRLNNL